MGDEVIDHEGHGTDGQGEAQSLHGGLLLGEAGVAHFHGVDADDLPVAVDEGAAGVAVIQSGVGLDHGHGAALHLHLTVDGGDDAVGKGPPQLYAQGIADGVHRVTHRQQVGVAELRRRQGIVRNGPQYRQILVLVIAHQTGVVGDAGVQRHPAALAAGDNVGVGDDIAALGHDDAGTHGGRAVGLLRHHRHHRRVHLSVHLLNGKLLTGGVLTAELHALLPGDAGNGGLLLAEDIHHAAGGVAVVAARQAGGAGGGGGQDGRYHDDHDHQRYAAYAQPRPQTAALTLGLGGLLPDVLRYGALLDEVVDDLLRLLLPGGVPADDLVRFLLRQVRPVLLRLGRQIAAYRVKFSVFVIIHRILPLTARSAWGEPSER